MIIEKALDMRRYSSLFRFIVSEYIYEGVYLHPEEAFQMNYTETKSKMTSLSDYVESSNGTLNSELVLLVQKVAPIFQITLKKNKQNGIEILEHIDRAVCELDVGKVYEFLNTHFNEENRDSYRLLAELRVLLTSLVSKLIGQSETIDWIVSEFSRLYDKISYQSRAKYGDVLVFHNEAFGNVHIVDNYDDLQKKITSLDNPQGTFYRGHDKVGYLLIPSLFRSKSYLRNEHRLFHDVLDNKYREFNHLHNTQEYLSKMQHYGVPTRLLDITSSWRVASFFASQSDSLFGEIFVFNFEYNQIRNANHIDVEALSSLAILDYNRKKQLIALSPGTRVPSTILADLKKAFCNVRDDMISESFLGYKVVIDGITNDRVFKQKGSFILFGLDAANLKMDPNVTNRIVIRNKKQIRNFLDEQGYNHLELFPELEHTCSYYKNKYS
jgi:hypothetical protein